MRRQGRRVRVRSSHRFRRWGVGVLDEEQPQQPQQSPGLDGNAEGASPDEPTGEFASAASHAQGWFLQKILAKTTHVSKKPRGLGMQDLPEAFASGALLGEGAYARTYRYSRHVLGDIALKVLKHREVDDFMWEVDLMASLNHPQHCALPRRGCLQEARHRHAVWR